MYVVDSSDTLRIAECRDELTWILESDDMYGVPVVVLANKQDLPGALPPAELASKLGLHQLRGHNWFIQGTCAVNGDGLFESMQELAKLTKEFKKNRR